MIETTKDILWLVLALCIFLFTVFSCWVIYYVATILREAKKMIQDFRKKIELLEGVIKALKTKLEKSSSYLKLAVDGIETVVNFLKAKKTEEKKKRKKRKK